MIYLFGQGLDLKQIIIRDGVMSAVRTEQTSGASLLSVELREDADVSGILYVGHFDTVNLKQFYVYRILSTTFNKDCWEIEGVDFAYDDLSVSLIKDIRPTDKTPAEILAQILEGTMWGVGDVDPMGTITTNYYYQTRLECVQDLCKLTGAILSPSYGFDGKYITSRQISLLWSVGEDRGKRFVHGSNLISVVQENDNSAIYTALVGRGGGVAIEDDEGEETGGYSRKITFGDVVWSVEAGDPVDKPLGQEYVEIPEYTAAYGLLDGKPRVGIVEFDGEENPVNLLWRTYERVLVSGRPQVSYKAVVRDVGDVGLDDTVTIIRPLPSGYDIRYKTKVYKRVVDLLMPQSSVLYFGDVVQNYVSGKLSELGDKIAEQERSTIGLIDLIKQGKIKVYWGEDGYNYDLFIGNEYGLPAGLYSFDRPINEDPTKFAYIGAGKVVISNEKTPDGSWVLKTFLDGDGLAAGIVTADEALIERLQVIDNRILPYENQLVIEPGQISMYIETDGIRVPVTTWSQEQLSFYNEGVVTSYFAGQQMFIDSAEVVNTLKAGNHTQEKWGTKYTVFRYTGGES